MGDEKRYYWLKLAEDFYDDDTIQWIEEQENGVAYVNFYLKLLLKSLKDDGYLIRVVGKRLIPYDVKSLAKLTNTDPDTVRVAMELFKQVGLVELLDSGEIYMAQIDEMIGSETQAAKRMRKLRAKQSLESSKNEPKKQLQAENRNNVTKERNNVQKCYTEYRDRDKEIDIDIYSQAKPDNTLNKTVDEVINYLNKKADKNYRNSQYARKHINARLNEGYTIEDFNKVVDNKVADWKGNKEFDKFLRPQTLFGNKFESYLNEKPMKLNRTESRESFTQGLGW